MQRTFRISGLPTTLSGESHEGRCARPHSQERRHKVLDVEAGSLAFRGRLRRILWNDIGKPLPHFGYPLLKNGIGHIRDKDVSKAANHARWSQKVRQAVEQTHSHDSVPSQHLAGNAFAVRLCNSEVHLRQQSVEIGIVQFSDVSRLPQLFKQG